MFKIAIDAGHFFHTPGKRTPDGEREWTFNNEVVKAVIQELGKYQSVDILRLDDPTGKTDIPLKARTNRANAWQADVLISVHHNAMTGKWGAHSGVETFTFEPVSGNPKSKALADKVHPKIVGVMGISNRGIKGANFHMLRASNMPAILTEGGFMDSTVDIKKMRDDMTLAAQGVAIATGIAEYAGLKKKVVQVSNPVKPSTVKKPAYPVAVSDRRGEVRLKSDAIYRYTPDDDGAIITTLKEGHAAHYYDMQGHWVRLGHGWVKSMHGSVVEITKEYKEEEAVELYRVSVNEESVGAFGNLDNVVNAVQKAVEDGQQKIAVEKVKGK